MFVRLCMSFLIMAVHPGYIHERCRIGFYLLWVIQKIRRSGKQTAQNARHGLLNSLPITNKWRCSGRHTERPTVKVVAREVSDGMLDGSATCRCCELAYSELCMFNLSQSSTLTHSRQNKSFFSWEATVATRTALAIFAVTFLHDVCSRQPSADGTCRFL